MTTMDRWINAMSMKIPMIHLIISMVVLRGWVLWQLDTHFWMELFERRCIWPNLRNSSIKRIQARFVDCWNLFMGFVNPPEHDMKNSQLFFTIDWVHCLCIGFFSILFAKWAWTFVCLDVRWWYNCYETPKSNIDALIEIMTKKFWLKNLGPLHYFLGMEFSVSYKWMLCAIIIEVHQRSAPMYKHGWVQASPDFDGVDS